MWATLSYIECKYDSTSVTKCFHNRFWPYESGGWCHSRLRWHPRTCLPDAVKYIVPLLSLVHALKIHVNSWAHGIRFVFALRAVWIFFDKSCFSWKRASSSLQIYIHVQGNSQRVFLSRPDVKKMSFFYIMMTDVWTPTLKWPISELPGSWATHRTSVSS